MDTKHLPVARKKQNTLAGKKEKENVVVLSDPNFCVIFTTDGQCEMPVWADLLENDLTFRRTCSI